MHRQWLARLSERLKRLMIFNPSGWPRRELISRCCALGVVTIFLAIKIYHFNDFPKTFHTTKALYVAVKSPSGQDHFSTEQIAWIWGVKLLVWLVETAIFLGYIAAYASRTKAVSVAQGLMETAFPIAVAGIPVLIALAPYNLCRWLPMSSRFHLYLYSIIMGLIGIGGLINLIGLMTLRRAFTIMTEAREMITHGIFRYVRHPLYTGHFIMFFGSLLLRLHSYTIMMFILFVWGQVIRARHEERKLQHAFPQFASYRENTGMFFPRLKKP